MKLNVLLEELSKYKEGLTQQRWAMDNYSLKNDYIQIIRVDTSNKAGGSNERLGKQWSIIFERTTNKRLEDLTTFKVLAKESGYIKITPRIGYPNQYGIRVYKMAQNPDARILDILFDYLFN